MGLVPGIDGAAGVDRRDRWELQLYGIDVFSRICSFCLDLEKVFARMLESVLSITERIAVEEQAVDAHKTGLQNLRTYPTDDSLVML